MESEEIRARHRTVYIMTFVLVTVATIFNTCYWNGKYNDICTYEADMKALDTCKFSLSEWFPYTKDDTLLIKTEDGNEYRFFVSELKKTPKKCVVTFLPIATDLSYSNKSSIEITFKNKSDYIVIDPYVGWYDKSQHHWSYPYSMQQDKFVVMNLDKLEYGYNDKAGCYSMIYEKNKGVTQLLLTHNNSKMKIKIERL